MSRRADELARRREQLIGLCEAQRAAIETHVGALATPLGLADRALRVVHYLRTHPLALGGVVAAIVAMRPRWLLQFGRTALTRRGSLLMWVQRGLLAWRAWRAWRSRRVPG